MYFVVIIPFNRVYDLRQNSSGALPQRSLVDGPCSSCSLPSSCKKKLTLIILIVGKVGIFWIRTHSIFYIVVLAFKCKYERVIEIFAIYTQIVIKWSIVGLVVLSIGLNTLNTIFILLKLSRIQIGYTQLVNEEYNDTEWISKVLNMTAGLPAFDLPIWTFLIAKLYKQCKSLAIHILFLHRPRLKVQKTVENQKKMNSTLYYTLFLSLLWWQKFLIHHCTFIYFFEILSY